MTTVDAAMSSELVKRLRAKAKLYDEIDEGEFTMLRNLMTEAADRIEALELGAEWVRLPKEATALMILAGNRAGAEYLFNSPASESVVTARANMTAAIYAAMLAAAPKED